MIQDIQQGNALLKNEIDFTNSQVKSLTQLMKKNEKLGENILIEGDAYVLFPYFQESFKNSTDITLVTQISFERMDRLASQIKRFQKGDISASIFIQIEMFKNKFQSNIYLINEYMVENFPELKNINIHLVLGMDYKINTLRNIAIQYSKTDMIFIVDGDIIPEKNFFDVYKSFGPPKPKSCYLMFEYDLRCDNDVLTDIDQCYPVQR